MPRILYVLVNEGGIQGGDKMIVRHVEALRSLGFDAYVYIAKQAPEWMAHQAPLTGGRIEADDLVVLPDDAGHQLGKSAKAAWRTVIFSQNPYYFATRGLQYVDAYPPAKAPRFIAVAPGLAATIRRCWPAAEVEVVRCFADERAFRADAKLDVVLFAPRKRPLEAEAIEKLFGKLHPEHAHLQWTAILKRPEKEVATAMSRAALFLSLSRLESVGMTTLEAMASGCVCAGFLGVGGREYATPDNGFWVPDDDCVAAADAVAEAAALVRAGGAALQRRLDAGFETARAWSYAVFRQELEAAWMRLAPEFRTLAPVSAG
jgi:glycosyltransferase involved in cell wall biosynthesis